MSIRGRCNPFFGLLLILFASVALGHSIHGTDRDFIEASTGVAVGPFIYLGAKHMITGYDHILYLVGVVFFLNNFRDILKIVSLFAVGHSMTLVFGVFADINVNAHLVDALIGFSVAYKAYENLAGTRVQPYLPPIPVAVFFFGLIHGFGLATKLQEFRLSADGLFNNIISFNLGVELGQIAALGIILLAFQCIRKLPLFDTFSLATNWILLVCGCVLMTYQISSYFYA